VISAVALGVLGVASFVAPWQDTTGAVFGRVLSAESGEAIAGASVRIRQAESFRFIVTEDDGSYRAAGLAPGDVVVGASALDHAMLEAGVRIPAGGEVSLDLLLELRPIALPPLLTEVLASQTRLPPPGLTRGGLRDEGETELRALESTPGVAELGLAGPRVRGPHDPASVLYVRGAAADLKLVLLDGAPVYAPFHLSGLLDAFPDGVLRNAKLYTGGTPARYDGGLSYVLDLDIREAEPDRLHSAGAIDLLGATGRLEGPIGPAARIMLSGRTLHGLGYAAISGESNLPYGYGDALGRVDLDLGAGHVSATGFWNRESVELDIGKLEAGDAPETAYWGNTSGSLRYTTPLGAGALSLTTAYGRFITQIPVSPEEAAGPLGFSTARGQNQRTRSEAFYELDGEAVRWQFGAGFDTHGTALDERTVFGETAASAVGRAQVFAAWSEVGWDVAPDVELRVGVRSDYFDPADVVRVAPRASVRWQVGEHATLSLAAGRFNQIVRGPESILSSDLTGPTIGRRIPVLDQPEPAPGQGLLSVAGANHLVVGLENELENGIDIGLEGYFKTFDGLPGLTNLYSSGADIWIHAEDGPVRGWLGYSLAWVWTTDPTDETRFVGRQLLSGGVSTDVRGFDLGVRLAYGSGLPFAEVSSEGGFLNGPVTGLPPPDEEGPPPALSGAPDDSYLRIDAEISRRVVARVAGTRIQIAPYVRLLNALDRRDALFYRSEEEGPARTAPLASIPLLAVVGIAWAF